ncbi:MAG: histidine phosphatase family protein [Gammaproteobacteria bacterium]|nr:histidine phosphatase family protein [Gammaproteobacteria bacterium]
MRTKEKSTNITFLRHGQTDFPTNRIYCDDIEDPELNENGLNQAKSAANTLKAQNIRKIYCSPAKRTMMTAKEVVDVTGAELEIVPDWVERRFGKWEGMYFKEVEETFSDEYLLWKQDMVNYTPEGGETINDVKARLAKSLSTIRSKHINENILIVTHVGPIRISLCQAMSIPLQNYRQIRIDYASMSRVDYGETMNNLIFLNQYNY